jgi:hypothetical protein
MGKNNTVHVSTALSDRKRKLYSMNRSIFGFRGGLNISEKREPVIISEYLAPISFSSSTQASHYTYWAIRAILKLCSVRKFRTHINCLISRKNKSININFMVVMFSLDCENFFYGVVAGFILTLKHNWVNHLKTKLVSSGMKFWNQMMCYGLIN